MAYFAELDTNNVVTRVLVVSDDDITDQDGNQQESLGITFLQGLLGQNTDWVQTCCDGSFRDCFASVGYTYDEVNDIFVPPTT